MFDPISYMWHWITSSTPLTGGWVTILCLAVAVPLGIRQAVGTWQRDHEKIRRSGRPPGLRGKDYN